MRPPYSRLWRAATYHWAQRDAQRLARDRVRPRAARRRLGRLLVAGLGVLMLGLLLLWTADAPSPFDLNSIIALLAVAVVGSTLCGR